MLRAHRQCSLIAGFFLVAACTFAQDLRADSGTAATRISELELRALIKQPVTPIVQREDLPAHPGPAVAEVTFSSAGKILIVTILEAPSMQAARAVRSALKTWKFKPQKPKATETYVGKLTFYFDITPGGVSVKMPT